MEQTALARRAAQREAASGALFLASSRSPSLVELVVHAASAFRHRVVVRLLCVVRFPGLRGDDRAWPRRLALLLKRPDTYYDERDD